MRAARTAYRRPLTAICASGWASRLYVHAGCFSRAKLVPATMAQPWPSAVYMRIESRGWPLRAPIVRSTSEGTRRPLNWMELPVTVAIARSIGGMRRGASQRKARVRVIGATTARTVRTIGSLMPPVWRRRCRERSVV